MKTTHNIRRRNGRVREQILHDLAELIRGELKDPRLGFVTLTDAEITRDYSRADIYYTVLEAERREDSRDALNSARGFLRTELARRIDLYRVPELRFVYDDSVEHGMKIDGLIRLVEEEKPVPE